jgi:peroxidase
MYYLQPQQISAAPGIVDELVAGLATQESNLWDNSFVPDIRDHLFEGAVGAGGLDLVALNIQRGRDHGVKGFFIGHLTTNSFSNI